MLSHNFVVFSYVRSCFGTLYQEKYGNPGANTTTFELTATTPAL
jgi:hypothetical protein